MTNGFHLRWLVWSIYIAVYRAGLQKVMGLLQIHWQRCQDRLALSAVKWEQEVAKDISYICHPSSRGRNWNKRRSSSKRCQRSLWNYIMEIWGTQNIQNFITYHHSSLLNFCLFLSLLHTYVILNFFLWKVTNRNKYESTIFLEGCIWTMLVFKQFMEKYVKAINKFSVQLRSWILFMIWAKNKSRLGKLAYIAEAAVI